jgi:rhamnose utilization protein RhaD (predicted bifunctional aldolase and dehydrogenase)
MLTQGPGGNTSIKIGDKLYVKGSGMWLADACSKNVFCEAPLPLLRRAIAEDQDGETIERCVKDLAANGLRPSIETSLHALMPHPIVIHLHAVDVLAWVTLRGARETIGPAMNGLAWAWIPYRRPGAPLTALVRASMAAEPDILLLANHGVVVGGASIAQVRHRLNDLLARLKRTARAPRPSGEPHGDVTAAAALHGFRPAKAAEADGLASDDESYELLQRGVFYPDQAIFLGPEIPVVDGLQAIGAVLANWRERYRRDPACLVIKGRGAFVREGANAAVDEQLLCHALFLARVSRDDDLETLSLGDIGQLLNWEAEVYRQTMLT